MRSRLNLILTLLIIIGLGSCTSGDQKSDSEDVEAVDEMANVPFTRSGSIDTSLVIITKSNSFSKWQVAFNSMSPIMKEHGLEKVNMLRGLKDSNMAFTLHKINDLKLAEDYASSDVLLAPLNEVSSDEMVSTYLLDQQLEYNKPSDDTLYMFMTFKTLEYNRWEKAFLDDYRNDQQRDFEVIRVFRGLRDRDQVYMLFKVNDPQYIEKTEKDNAFKMKMLASGVVSYPVTYKLVPAEV